MLVAEREHRIVPVNVTTRHHNTAEKIVMENQSKLELAFLNHVSTISFLYTTIINDCQCKFRKWWKCIASSVKSPNIDMREKNIMNFSFLKAFLWLFKVREFNVAYCLNALKSRMFSSHWNSPACKLFGKNVLIWMFLYRQVDSHGGYSLYIILFIVSK